MELRPGYPLRTERLLLRPAVPADAAAMAVYKGRADVTRYIPHGPLSVDDILERISRQRTTLDDAGQHLPLAVLRREDQVLVGDVILFWHSREHRGGEIGYVFDPAHGGHGYATEAARELLRLGFDELGLHRIVGRIDPANDASRRVLQRLGMRHEAHMLSTEFLQGRWTDEDVFAILEDEWRAQRA
jgi:RimJ/RimL family protein N-acetyltransferase